MPQIANFKHRRHRILIKDPPTDPSPTESCACHNWLVPLNLWRTFLRYCLLHRCRPTARARVIVCVWGGGRAGGAGSGAAVTPMPARLFPAVSRLAKCPATPATSCCLRAATVWQCLNWRDSLCRACSCTCTEAPATGHPVHVTHITPALYEPTNQPTVWLRWRRQP